jgi:8-amino-7-oxononanoate synthase
MHCSPPSLAHVTAGAQALSVNSHAGERKRARLGSLVDRFRRKLGDAGLPVPPGRFPVQSLPVPRDVDAGAVYRGLLGYSVRAVLHRPQCRGAPAISFLITACHSAADIDAAVVALRCAMGRVDVLPTIRE